uniref:C2H2-type domain-containing protein n=1 Tax=Magallana gigas TaxID=29159 RepID=K1QBH6_MAGGI
MALAVSNSMDSKWYLYIQPSTVVKKGCWMGDLKQVAMPKTKITLNKGRKCPFCPYRFNGDDEFAKHIGNCSQNLLFCNYCDFSSTTPKNLRRHLKRQHDIGEENSGEADGLNLSSAQCDGNESDAESWVRQDPGDLQSVLQEDISDGESDNDDSAEARSKKKSMSSLFTIF